MIDTLIEKGLKKRRDKANAEYGFHLQSLSTKSLHRADGESYGHVSRPFVRAICRSLKKHTEFHVSLA